MSSLPMPHVIFNFPHGVDIEDYPEPNWHPLIDHCWESEAITPEGRKFPLRDRSTYSLLRNFQKMDGPQLESWSTVYGVFAPTYKKLLYGNKYRSMLELDIVKSPLFDQLQEKVLYDKFYETVDDVSESAEYFHFYDIWTKGCDICNQQVSADSSSYVSAMTIRQNNRLLQQFMAEKDAVSAFTSFVTDWTGWLVCHNCADRYNFRRR